ncbi:hypothetical protein Sfum_2403 [Syntrophobacter fumaroxidans MPOB]|uniref:Uncharacterized protein n=1 Tax=Syntrophobacter fumaroxidans (strain DSM 10017 / MPOB) TaxID=335543 RepID=A0LKY2_SYNFM|nr:hypothetical protein Sfum_2403 [Syntrophobacter fumaroxidans MPOB]
MLQTVRDLLQRRFPGAWGRSCGPDGLPRNSDVSGKRNTPPLAVRPLSRRTNVREMESWGRAPDLSSIGGQPPRAGIATPDLFRLIPDLWVFCPNFSRQPE